MVNVLDPEDIGSDADAYDGEPDDPSPDYRVPDDDEDDDSRATTTNPDPTDPAQDPGQSSGSGGSNDSRATTSDPDPTDPAQDPTGGQGPDIEFSDDESPPDDPYPDEQVINEPEPRGDGLRKLEPGEQSDAQFLAENTEFDREDIRGVERVENDAGETLLQPVLTRDARRELAAEELEGVEIDDIAQVSAEGDVIFTQSARIDRAADELEGVDAADIRAVGPEGEVTFTEDARRERQALDIAEQIAEERESVDDPSEVDVTIGEQGFYVDLDREGPGRIPQSAEPSISQPSVDLRQPAEFAEPSINQPSAEDFTPGDGETETDIDVSPTARKIDAATDAIAENNPVATAGISALATSLRTDAGLPIPGTGARLPGRSDVRRVTDRLEGPTERIDTAIDTSVDTVTLGRDDLDIDLGTETVVDIGSTNPGLAAGATVLGTGLGREGAREGVTSGVQAFNPGRIATDAVRFTDVGVRATDRVLDADETEIQQGLNVGEQAVDAAPGLAVGAVASDPSRLVSVPVGAATVVGLGALGGAAAAGGARTAARAGRTGGRAASALGGQTTRAVRRSTRDISDLEIELTRDPDSGPVDLDLGDSSRFNLLEDFSPGDAPRAARQRVELAGRRTARSVDDTLTDARFTADEAVGAVRDAPRVARQRAEIGAQRTAREIDDFLSDLRFSADESVGAVRDAPRVARQRAELAGRRAARSVDETLTDLRFSVDQARSRPSELAGDIEDSLREFGSSGFLGDTRTRRTRPLGLSDRFDTPSGPDLDFDLGGGFLADTGTGRTRPFLGGAGRAADARRRARDVLDVDVDTEIGGAFLADETTGRTRPFLGGVDRAGDVTPSLPSVPRSLDDLGVGGEGSLSDLTLRVSSGRTGRDVVDIEDLAGPDPSEGAPTFRKMPWDVDPDARTGASGTQSQLETDIDLGGGQTARMRQRQRDVDVDSGPRARSVDDLETDTGGSARPLLGSPSAFESDLGGGFGDEIDAGLGGGLDVDGFLADEVGTGLSDDVEVGIGPRTGTEPIGDTITGPTSVQEPTGVTTTTTTQALDLSTPQVSRTTTRRPPRGPGTGPRPKGAPWPDLGSDTEVESFSSDGDTFTKEFETPIATPEEVATGSAGLGGSSSGDLDDDLSVGGDLLGDDLGGNGDDFLDPL